MYADLAELVRLEHTRRQWESRVELSACSLCLRVLRGSEWVEAERVIREIRSYELEAPPQLHAALCNFCVESVLSRRARRGEPLLA
jgi:hypothetical protein